MGNTNDFHKRLKELIDSYVHKVYDATKHFPKDELFGATSQLRRAAMSVALNYTEGYARKREAVVKNFLEISYGSLKESQYLVDFAEKRGWISDSVAYAQLVKLSDEIGAMLWKTTSLM